MSRRCSCMRRSMRSCRNDSNKISLITKNSSWTWRNKSVSVSLRISNITLIASRMLRQISSTSYRLPRRNHEIRKKSLETLTDCYRTRERMQKRREKLRKQNSGMCPDRQSNLRRSREFINSRRKNLRNIGSMLNEKYRRDRFKLTNCQQDEMILSN